MTIWICFNTFASMSSHFFSFLSSSLWRWLFWPPKKWGNSSILKTIKRMTSLKKIFKFVQWKPLNDITDYVIIWLMWSNLTGLTKSHIATNKVLFVSRTFAYCYCLFNVISFSLSQSENITIQLLLHCNWKNVLIIFNKYFVFALFYVHQ